MPTFSKLLLIFIATMGLSCIIYIDRCLPNPKENIFESAKFDNFDVPEPTEFQIDTRGCKIPFLHPYHPTIRRFMNNITNVDIDCSAPQLFFVEGQTLKVNFEQLQKIRNEHGNISCSYVPIIYAPARFQFKYPPRVIELSVETVIDDEFIMVECSKSLLQIYQDFFATIVTKPDVERRCNEASKVNRANEKMNVLLLGMESVSRNHFYRKLRKTAEFIRQKVKFVDFVGYNKLGHNTFANLFPLLTGKLHTEFASDFSDVDINTLPMIWKKFGSRGYRTLFAEDGQRFSALTWSLIGFDNPSPDYYIRPLTSAVERSNIVDRFQKGCYVNRSETYALLKWTLDFFDRFKGDPLFAFVFLARRSHDHFNNASYPDKELLYALRQLYTNGYFENTIVFFFADRGFQNMDIRLTYQGRVEEKLPFLFVLLPKSFLMNYPDFYRNLKLNQKRLVTALDVHATLEHIVEGLGRDENKNTDGDGRHVSLFTPVSDKRTCRTANIDALYCTCFGRQRTAIDTDTAKELASVLMDSINEQVEDEKKLCATLELVKIVDVVSYINDTGHLIKNEVSVEVKPGGGIFRGIVFINEISKLFSIGLNINRINLYENQSHCINVRHLKPFCFCNVQVVY